MVVTWACTLTFNSTTMVRRFFRYEMNELIQSCLNRYMELTGCNQFEKVGCHVWDDRSIVVEKRPKDCELFGQASSILMEGI